MITKSVTELSVIVRLDGEVEKALKVASFLSNKPISSWIKAIRIITYYVNLHSV